MNCDRLLLSEYRDGELPPPARRRVEAHLAACPECRGVLGQYQALGRAIRAFGDQPAPAWLSDEFHARLEAGAPPLASRLASLLRRDRWRSLTLGVVGAIAAVLLFVVGLNLASTRPIGSLVVVAAYPRDGATGVMLDKPIEVEFSEPVDQGGVELAVRVEPAVPVESSLRGRKLIVRPKEPLQPGTQYAVSIEAKRPAAETAQPVPTVTLSFSTRPVTVALPSPTAAALAASIPSATPMPQATVAIAAIASPASTSAPLAAPTVAPTATSQPTPAVAIAAAIPPAAGPAPCAIEPSRRLAQVYRQHAEVAERLGCAQAPEKGLAVVEQSFAGGVALWLSDRSEVEVLFTDGRRASYPHAGRPEAATTPTRAVTAAVRSLGRLLEERQDLRAALGAPAAPESGRWAYLQAFARGTLLSTDANWVYVLYEDGTWQKLPSGSQPSLASPTTTATIIPAPSTATAPATAATPPIPTASASPGVTGTPVVPDAPPTPTASTTPSPTSTPTPGEGVPVISTPSVETTPTASPTDPASVGAPTPTPTAPPPAQPPRSAGSLLSGAPVNPTSDPSACEVAVVRSFGLVRAARPELSRRLGCAVAPERPIQAAHQYFEGGYVYWRADVRQVYVLYDDSTWLAFADTWRGENGEDSEETPADGRQVPTRAIGRASGEKPDARTRLGLALTVERGFSGVIQPFERGLMLKGDNRRVYALYSNGTWQSLSDEYREVAR